VSYALPSTQGSNAQGRTDNADTVYLNAIWGENYGYDIHYRNFETMTAAKMITDDQGEQKIHYITKALVMGSDNKWKVLATGNEGSFTPAMSMERFVEQLRWTFEQKTGTLLCHAVGKSNGIR
jgi:hypothetical protein